MYVPFETIAQKITRLRMEKGLSKYRLAKLTGIREQYIGQLEAGKSEHPRQDTLVALSKGLGVSPSVFFNEDDLKNVDGEVRDFLVNDFPNLDPESKDWVRRTISMVREKQKEKYNAGKE
jgi:transcriptional regulator with XRE-family HTH domain